MGITLLGFKTKLQISVLAGAAFLALGLLAPHKAHAQYVEGNLIDDSLFLDAARLNPVIS